MNVGISFLLFGAVILLPVYGFLIMGEHDVRSEVERFNGRCNDRQWFIVTFTLLGSSSVFMIGLILLLWDAL